MNKKTVNDIYPSVKYTINSCLSGDYDQWVNEINGEVFGDDCYGDNILIGKCRYFYVDLKNSEQSAYNLLDTRGELLPYMCMYRHASSTFTDDVLELCGDLWYFNLFIIDRIELLPDYRGHGLAKAIIDDAISLFAPNTDVMALKALPLQFEYSAPNSQPNKWKRMMNTQALESNEENAMKKLISYYETHGFKCLNPSFDIIILILYKPIT